MWQQLLLSVGLLTLCVFKDIYIYIDLQTMLIYVNLLTIGLMGVNKKHLQFIQHLKETEPKWQNQIEIQN